MAISFIGSAEGANSASTTITLTLPGGRAIGDVVYVVEATDINTSPGGMSTSGYTTIISTGGTGVLPGLAVHRKVLTALDSSAVVNAVVTTHAAVLSVLRGVSKGTPEDTSATSANGTGSGPNSPSITTVTDGAWVLSCAASNFADTTVTAPTGYTNQVDISLSTGGITCAMASKMVSPAGAEDPAAWTNWTQDWRAYSVAVRPGSRPIIRRPVRFWSRPFGLLLPVVGSIITSGVT